MILPSPPSLSLKAKVPGADQAKLESLPKG